MSWQRRRSARLVLGVADQGLSSASNLVLAVLVARSVEPRDFGAFAVVYAVYVLAIGASLSLNGEFYSMRFAGKQGNGQRIAAQQAAGGAVLVGVLVGATILTAAALLRTSPVGGLLLILAACLPGLLLQDSMRNVLIASGRAHLALASDLFWLVSFVLIAWFLAPARQSAGSLLLLWGLLGVVSAIALLPTVGMHLRPLTAAAAWHNERSIVQPLFAEFLSVEGSWQVTTLLLPAVIGLSALGGFRAAMVIFGPLNVIFNASRSVAVPSDWWC
jgi:O-antigen/teichoic acid export membrane protein